MNQDDMIALVERLPADPFTIHMSDGSTYSITRQELITVGKRSVCVLVPNDKDIDIFERLTFLHMVRIEHQVPRPA